MIGALGAIVKNVIVIVLLSSFLEMLLPDNSLKRFIKIVVGLFIMITILNPILHLLGEGLAIDAWQLQIPGQEDSQNVLASGQRLTDLQKDLVLEELQKRLQIQIQSLVLLMPEVESVQSVVSLEDFDGQMDMGRISSIVVEINLWALNNQESFITPVEPVAIVEPGQTEDTEEGHQKIKRKIKLQLASYFDVDEEYITIFIK